MSKRISPSHLNARDALRHRLARRLVRNAGIVAALITAALGIGATGYHVLAGLPWLDAALNASMILTGMGPVSPVTTPPAKVFAIGYSLFSGVFFLTMVALLLAPAVQHLLHRFHLDLSEQDVESPEKAPATAHRPFGDPVGAGRRSKSSSRTVR